MLQLRKYQLELVRRVDQEFSTGNHHLCVQLATGGGKTVVAAELVRRLSSRRVLYVVPSREIFAQTEEKLERAGILATMLSAGSRPDMRRARCVLAMSQTLSRRLQDGFFDSWRPDLLIVDEAHRLLDQHIAVMQSFRCPSIALTATPVRLDGRSLGEIWPTLITGPQIQDLIIHDAVVPTRTLSIPLADVRRVRKRHGDYEAASLAKAFENSRAADLAAILFRRYGERRPAVGFCPSVKVSETLVNALNTFGIRAVHVDSDSKPEERAEALAKLARNEIDFLSNCGLFVEGLDVPCVSCVVVCTSTLSLSKWLQMCGRGSRPSPGKRDLLVIDHGGCASALGLPDADRDWYFGGRPDV